MSEITARPNVPEPLSACSKDSTSRILGLAGQITATVAACEHEIGESRSAFLARAEEARFRAKRDRDNGLNSVCKMSFELSAWEGL